MDNLYTDGRHPTRTQKFRTVRPSLGPKLLTCHFCGNNWDSKNRCFVCPKCHTVYNPQKSPAIGFGGEVRIARLRENMSQAELAKIIGTNSFTIRQIEGGKELKIRRKKGLFIRERLRIWVESTKSPIDRRNEIENMFNSNQENR